MNYKAKVLIVDDEPINIMLMEKALKDTYEICTAWNGYDALRQVREARPDLILLDVMMPDMNGFDVCKIIKAEEIFADIPVLFLTAMDTMAGELMGLELGGIDYLTKPFNIDLLKLRVRNHVELKRRNDHIREQRDLLVHQKQALEAMLARVRHLEGTITICMHCKSIRNDDASWQALEVYIMQHSDALFSHGLCPACRVEHYKIIDKMS